MSAFYDQASLVVVPSGYKSGKIYAQKPLTTDGQLTFTRASTATRVNASGLIASVASGVPRLDYLGSSCPKILLEPQRVNYQLNSQVFSNWYDPDDGVTLIDNTTDTLDPSGTNTAEKVTVTGGNKRIYDIVSIPAGSSTYSVFVKAGTGNLFTLFTSNAAFSVSFNLSTQSVTASVGTGTITSYGNGWYRCTATGTTPSGDVIQLLFPNSVGQTTYIWGAQWEAGSYATSYIPTTSAAVTRLADFAKKENIGGTLPTVYPFTLYSESDFYLGSDDFGLSMIDITTTNNYFTFGTFNNKYIGVVRSSSGEIVAMSTANYTPGFNKVALVVTSNSIKVFANGALVATATNTLAFNAGVNDLIVGTLREASNLGTRNSCKQALVFKSALTDAQCVELTTL